MIPLEDTAADILGKAQRGLGISDSHLAERTAVGADRARLPAPRAGDDQ